MPTARRPAPDWGALDIPAFTPPPAQTGNSPRKPRKPMAIAMSTIEAKEVRYLWFPYIPYGKLTTIDGDPGIGKSWITIALTAAVTTGKSLPGEEIVGRKPGTVLILNSEDDAADTTRPRLDLLQADVHKVFITSEFFTLDGSGLDKLRDLITETGCTLVIIDPIQAWMGGKVDMNKANEVRAVMGPIGHLAAETGCAIVIVRHVRKSASGANHSEKAIYKGLGSVDGIAAVRSGLYAAEDGDRKVLHHIKTNVAKKGPPIEFTIGDQFSWSIIENHQFGPKPREARTTTIPKDHGPAKHFLMALLANGPVLASEALAQAKLKNISPRTLNRAKEGLVRSIRDPGLGPWRWALSQELIPAGTDAAPATDNPVGAPKTEPTSREIEDDAFAQIIASA